MILVLSTKHCGVRESDLVSISYEPLEILKLETIRCSQPIHHLHYHMTPWVVIAGVAKARVFQNIESQCKQWTCTSITCLLFESMITSPEPPCNSRSCFVQNPHKHDIDSSGFLLVKLQWSIPSLLKPTMIPFWTFGKRKILSTGATVKSLQPYTSWTLNLTKRWWIRTDVYRRGRVQNKHW